MFYPDYYPGIYLRRYAFDRTSGDWLFHTGRAFRQGVPLRSEGGQEAGEGVHPSPDVELKFRCAEGEKVGNNIRCDVPAPALRIIQSMDRTEERIFPFSTGTIGSAFTRAVAFLGIEDLHFHDLRHEGFSRLFEMGLSLPRIAAVSGHRSWNTLKRSTHLRQAGDKWTDWLWLEKITS